MLHTKWKVIRVLQVALILGSSNLFGRAAYARVQGSLCEQSATACFNYIHFAGNPRKEMASSGFDPLIIHTLRLHLCVYIYGSAHQLPVHSTQSFGYKLWHFQALTTTAHRELLWQRAPLPLICNNFYRNGHTRLIKGKQSGQNRQTTLNSMEGVSLANK